MGVLLLTLLFLLSSVVFALGGLVDMDKDGDYFRYLFCLSLVSLASAGTLFVWYLVSL